MFRFACLACAVLLSFTFGTLPALASNEGDGAEERRQAARATNIALKPIYSLEEIIDLPAATAAKLLRRHYYGSENNTVFRIGDLSINASAYLLRAASYGGGKEARAIIVRVNSNNTRILRIRQISGEIAELTKRRNANLDNRLRIKNERKLGWRLRVNWLETALKRDVDLINFLNEWKRAPDTDPTLTIQ